MLQAGASSLLGMRLADLIAKPTTASPIGRPRHFGKAKNVILLYLYGAVSQIDTLDPKPDAPAEIRGPFRSIATKVPGVRFGEHLPLFAERMDRITLVRSMTEHIADPQRRPCRHRHSTDRHSDGSECPRSAALAVLRVGRRLSRKQPGRRPPVIPRNILLPWRQRPRLPGNRAGFYGGFLGPRYDPTALDFQGRGNVATSLEPNNPYVGIEPGATFHFPATCSRRRSRSTGFVAAAPCSINSPTNKDGWPAMRLRQGYDELQQIALGLCDSGSLPVALDLDREPGALRARLWSSSLRPVGAFGPTPDRSGLADCDRAVGRICRGQFGVGYAQ